MGLANVKTEIEGRRDGDDLSTDEETKKSYGGIIDSLTETKRFNKSPSKNWNENKLDIILDVIQKMNIDLKL